MSLIVVCAGKGSPGVTTTALALAVAWPRRVGLAELDQAGGDLALRLTDTSGGFALASTPGLLTWAAGLSGPAVSVWGHCQLVGAVRVLPGLTSAEQAAGLAPLWPAAAAALADTRDGDVLADLGRLHPGSAVLPVVAAADLVVLVMSGTLDGLVHARDRLRGLDPVRSGRVAVVAVASDRDGPRTLDAIRTMLDRDGLDMWVAGFIAHDPAAVTRLYRCDRSARQQRSLLGRTAGEIAASLVDRLPAGRQWSTRPARPAPRPVLRTALAVPAALDPPSVRAWS